MKTLYRYFLQSPKISTLCVMTFASLIFNLWISQVLTNNYAASRFPVPYYVAQLSFNPEKIKAWYAYLIEQGSFAQYIHTQHVDSLFIISTIFFHTLALVLISRLFFSETKGRKVMVVCALLAAIAPISDQLENCIAYLMLANPANFPGVLAYIYSSFAAIKFAMFVFAYVTALVGIIAGIVLRIKRYVELRPGATQRN
ncbi:MAG: hypothetical protein V4732_08425 [Pseudomonadota bacterium]